MVGAVQRHGGATLSISNTGGTDHLAFDAIGLPGFQFIQDEIEYDTRTHHSNQDVFDRIQADDMKQAATIMAAFVYNTRCATRSCRASPPASKNGTGHAAGRQWKTKSNLALSSLRAFGPLLPPFASRRPVTYSLTGSAVGFRRWSSGRRQSLGRYLRRVGQEG